MRLLRLAIVIVATATSAAGCGATRPARPSSGEPDAAEVAQGLRAGGFERKRVTAAACRQTSAGHWACAVRFADGRAAKVLGIWYGRGRTLGLSLAQE